MIKANELRIGNVVETRSNKRGWIRYEMTGLNIYQLSAYGENFEKDVRPIPITEDLLLECGFIQDDIIDFRYHLEDWFAIDVDDCCIRIADSWMFGKINYLHELQNLYFTLTGDELKINTQDK
jgi:hypothetical protein